MTTLVVEAPLVLVEHVQPDTVIKYAAPSHDVADAALDSVDEYVAPSLAVTYTALALCNRIQYSFVAFTDINRDCSGSIS